MESDNQSEVVECHISTLELEMVPGAIHESFVLEKLRQSGIPVKGILTFRGVEKGSITRGYILHAS